jgi:hypothetical protein
MMNLDESGAFSYTIGWISSRYFNSDNLEEKYYIAQLLKNIKADYNITESHSLNLVIQDYYGSEQI